MSLSSKPSNLIKTSKPSRFQLKHGLALLSALALASCVSKPPQPKQYPVPQPTQQPPIFQQPAPKPPVVIQQPPVIVQPPVVRQPAPQATYRSFEDWKADFAARAIAQGNPAYDVNHMLETTSLNTRVISLDSNQPEFSKMPWDYADSAVSSGRVSNGQKNFAERRSLLNNLQSQYGVDAGVIAAIWGMESAYGQVTGNSYIPSSLASLAYEGRRRDFAEGQLTALLQLLRRGDVYWSQLDGSWAGGMGETQFIPGTWLAQGVDGDGDGRRNPWSTADALASTANWPEPARSPLPAPAPVRSLASSPRAPSPQALPALAP